MNILITGTSSGLGRALADAFSDYNVYGINRTNDDKVNNIQCNLANLKGIQPALRELTVKKWDYVFLNAGILGRLASTPELDLEEYSRVFNINVLANKEILDFLLERSVVKKVIGISSGAALKAYYGWSLYCCSKAAFKQLIATYAEEYPKTHFLSLAPGIIKTKMQDYIFEQNEIEIPSVSKFKKLYPAMESPSVVAERIKKRLPLLDKKPSGSYFDLREL